MDVVYKTNGKIKIELYACHCVSYGPPQPATWSYYTADCQPTAPVLSVSMVQSARMPYQTI